MEAGGVIRTVDLILAAAALAVVAPLLIVWVTR